MKHFVKISLCLLLIPALLAGCSRVANTVKAEDLAGKSYVYEKDGFGGDFVISLKEDGSFTYYEGSLSSYIGTGDWTVKGDTLTLQEKTQHVTFRVDGEELIFQYDESGNFLFIDVLDGEKFTAEE